MVGDDDLEFLLPSSLFPKKKFALRRRESLSLQEAVTCYLTPLQFLTILGFYKIIYGPSFLCVLFSSS